MAIEIVRIERAGHAVIEVVNPLHSRFSTVTVCDRHPEERWEHAECFDRRLSDERLRRVAEMGRRREYFRRQPRNRGQQPRGRWERPTERAA